MGLKNASFPDPRYAAIDDDGEPLPLEERRRFVPALPPSKRVYHPLCNQAGPAGPRRHVGLAHRRPPAP